MGNVYNQKDWAWEGAKDIESVMELFGYEGLDVEESMSVLAKLDKKQPFFAGKQNMITYTLVLGKWE